VGSQRTFGRSGQIRSQRSGGWCASRLGQSPLSCSFHFIMLPMRPVFLDQPGDAVTALARTFGAFDAEHVELAFDVTKNEICGPLGEPPGYLVGAGEQRRRDVRASAAPIQQHHEVLCLVRLVHSVGRPAQFAEGDQFGVLLIDRLDIDRE
jgi:hypothetical protein